MAGKSTKALDAIFHGHTAADYRAKAALSADANAGDAPVGSLWIVVCSATGKALTSPACRAKAVAKLGVYARLCAGNVKLKRAGDE